MPSLVGKSLGRYHILEQLGEGGMATVYKAYDARLEREVAVKIIRVDQFSRSAIDSILKRFEREAKALARLTHPNIVHINDFGEHEGVPYLVMDYLPGGTLKERMQLPMTWQAAVRLLLPVASALEYAHENKIIHRDVKPANILLTGKGQPMLTDFGIAKLLESEAGQTLTGTGLGIGTPEYMSPEQGLGKAIDGRADLYSLGIIFYELLTARKPYIAETPMSVIFKHISDPLPDPRQFAPNLPEAVVLVLSKALAKQPEGRYPDMEAFSNALETLTGQSKPEPAPRPVDPQSTLINLPVDLPTAILSEQILPVPTLHAPAPVALDEPASRPFSFKGWPLAAAALTVFILLAALAGWIAQRGTASPLQIGTPVPPTWTALPTHTAAPTGTDLPTLTPTPEATITSTPYPALITSQGAEMALIPAGTFLMGSDQNREDEKPPHSVTLAAFYMDKYEVTNALYAACVAEGKCDAPKETKSYTRASYYDAAEFANYPVINVDWNMAKAYCEWRGARLPTEAEWEKAARGGLEGKTYPWGDDAPTCTKGAANGANFFGCARDTLPVGSFASNGYGLYDMAGNVWEWTADWYSDTYYGQSPPVNPVGPTTGTYLVLRGGSWNYDPDDLRVSNRYRDVPDFRFKFYGYRCAR